MTIASDDRSASDCVTATDIFAICMSILPDARLGLDIEAVINLAIKARVLEQNAESVPDWRKRQYGNQARRGERNAQNMARHIANILNHDVLPLASAGGYPVNYLAVAAGRYGRRKSVTC